jgi:predicted AAA+ superfamily ATPase
MKNMVNILKYNHHWREGFTYGYEKKRELLDELIRYLNAKQIIGIIGLRRTGKTVILKQLIEHLIKQGKKRDRILYFSFDEESISLEDVISEYQSRLGTDILNAGRLYLFLDEIQKLEGWQNKVKYYYDTYPDIKFFVSGSSSLFLRKKAEESLAGRIFLFHLPVLSFIEFLHFKGEDELIRRPQMFKEKIIEETLLYARRQFPELVSADEDFINMYVSSILNKIIYEDLPRIFPIEYEDALKQILKIVASNPGIMTDYSALATDLGISRKTLSKYIFYLERGFLIQKCYNFSRNRLTSEKKMKKLYLSSTTLLFHLCESPDQGRVVENLVINSSSARFFWRRGVSEVDCVLVNDGSIIPLEVKYRNNIQKKEIKGLIKFLKNFSIEKGYVITKDSEEEIMINGSQILFLPLWKWLIQWEEMRTKKPMIG